MKILMIAPTPFFADRGCHTQIYEEIKALQKLGHSIVLCTYGLGRDVPGVKIVRTLNPPWYKKIAAGPSYTKILLLPFLTITAFATALSFRPDIIHGHLHEGALIARALQFFFRKKKYLFDMQGSLTGESIAHGFVNRNSLRHKLLSFIERRIANYFHVITQSDSMMKELSSFGVPETRRTNVHDGVDTGIFRPMRMNNELALRYGIEKKRPRVLFMGLLVTYQGADVMIEAFAKAAKKMHDIQFIVIGFPNIEKYQALCDSKGIGGQVKFLGRIDYLDLPRYLSLADIAVAPKISPTEGDGKIYNYMAMGMATVAFDRSVSREILGDTGIYAKFNDAADLAEKILWAIQHPSACKKLGARARTRAVANLSWDAVGKRIDEVYRRL
ncbi:MAG: glycosyltransferase family 4 protein [Spirochaetota bacterium]